MNLLREEAINSTYDCRDYKIIADKNLPETFELSNLPKVKDQGSKPTCVAHAAASLIEYYHTREHRSFRKFSTNFIYGFRDILYSMGDGMRIRDALKTLKDYGTPYYNECPGNLDFAEATQQIQDNVLEYIDAAASHRISNYYRCYSDADIKTALIKHGPVLASINTYEDYELLDDVYTFDPESSYGRHCILIYGWNDNGWLAQNSWGKNWAGDGRFIIPYTCDFNEAWGAWDRVDDVNIKKPSKLTLLLYKIYNFFGNLLYNK